jgi:DnaJ-class molecular chaperone
MNQTTPESTVTCPTCKGTRHYFEPTWNPVAMPCTKCKGTGRVPVSDAPPVHGEDIQNVLAASRPVPAAPHPHHEE